MRVLDFSGELGSQRYSIIMDGLMGTDRPFKAPVETRMLSRILDLLEGIGKAGMRGAASTFGLNIAGSVTVGLKESEFRLVVESLERVPWRPAGVRDITEALDWLTELPAKQEADE